MTKQQQQGTRSGEIAAVLAVATFLGVGVAAGVVGGKWVEVYRQQLRNAAVQECMALSSYTTTDDKTGVTSAQPIQQVYEECLQLKGY